MAYDAPMAKAADPVLISGAGPSGLALALSLTSSGVPVRLIDKAPEAATTSRAIGVQPRTLEMLEPFGLADTLADLGQRVRVGNIYNRAKRRLIRTDMTQLPTRHPYLLFVEQTYTERLLTEALQKLGVHVERGVEALSFEQSDNSVSASLMRQGEIEQATFSYMAACDGARSGVRRQLDLQFAGKTARQGFLLADLDVESELARDEYHIFASGNGLVAVLPLPAFHRLIVETEDSTSSSKNFDLSYLRTVVAQRIDVPLCLSNLRWSSYFQINTRLTPSFQRGRVFLVGDAGHIHSPAGAQGMNTGIQDALNLAWKLAFVLRGSASQELLETYDAERHPVAKDVLRRTEQMDNFVTMKSPLKRFWRDLIVPRVSARPSVQRRTRLAMSQLGVSYRAQIKDGSSNPEGLHPGDRVPDAWIKESEQPEARRLYSSFDPTRFTLLIIRTSTKDSSAIDLESTLETSHQMKLVIGSEVSGPGLDGAGLSAYGEHFYLIRPDGYLAVHGALTDIKAVTKYMATISEN